MTELNDRINCRVNLNGTSADQLCADWRDVFDAARKLREVLLLVYPHGRDYQTLPDWGKVEQEHDRAMHAALLLATRQIRDYAENSALYVMEKPE